jgi:hypothetical protein
MHRACVVFDVVLLSVLALWIGVSLMIDISLSDDPEPGGRESKQKQTHRDPMVSPESAIKERHVVLLQRRYPAGFL